ncbi:unnamed protein product [Withania somnifera]
MKHIVVEFHYVRQQVKEKCLIFKHIPSSNQLDDSLTKPLSKNLFHQYLSKLGVVCHHLA